MSPPQGATRIPIRVIEYVIEDNGSEKVYRLITDLMDISAFPALVLAVVVPLSINLLL
ncbi:hypothetical protein [Sphaerospermopsis torques-reginae]|uniref:hypothetical protein n=1 Tax=Sphaerospermopsis torques-reginae TaxID=984207 RepID=UPI001FE8F246|nr:hypothetical protein [Sphaerospermopsis torques-reginae]